MRVHLFIKQHKASHIAFGLVFIIGVLGILHIYSRSRAPIYGLQAPNTKQYTVSGASMFPILDNGQTVQVNTSAYDTSPILRDDIVIIKQPGDNGFLVKTVRAVPGDVLSLVESQGESNILLNNKILTNSEGRAYALSENKSRMIELYITEYHGVVHKGLYFVLGNKIQGSKDSSVFGLIDKDRIIGKVLTE